LVEFRNVATRPAAANGLGLTPTEAEAKAAEFEALFPLLPETAGIFPAWKALVAAAAELTIQPDRGPHFDFARHFVCAAGRGR
jgi:hypothetical protein